MKNKLSRLFGNVAPSLMSIGLGLFFGLVIIVVSGLLNSKQSYEDIWYGINSLILGLFNEYPASFGTGLFRATPIILTGLSVAFAFKTGLFNIGASGQFTVGGFAAIFVAINGPLPGIGNWILAVIAAALAGAIWGSIVGLLKAYRNVNEVISSIMLNYIGMYLVQYLIVQHVFDHAKNQSLPIPMGTTTPTLELDILFPNSSVDIGILIAVIAVIFVYILLNKTAFGYELKACGFNQDASLYAGINAKRNVVYSMMIAGAISGIAGSLVFLSSAGKHIEIVDVLASEGYTGISVALLGLSNPIGVFFSGLFIVHLQQGGFFMQSQGYAPQVVEMIIAAIIYFSAFIVIFKEFMRKRKGGKK